MALEERSQLPSNPASAATARRMVRRVVATALSPDLADTATLLVSELVSNAVLHARTEITITVRLDRRFVRVEVADENSTLPRTKVYSASSTTGRGLRLVDQLSDRWGIEVNSPGKSVWFELARAPAPDPSNSASRSDRSNPTAHGHSHETGRPDAPSRWSMGGPRNRRFGEPRHAIEYGSKLVAVGDVGI